MQPSITACSTGQSANHLHHRGDEVTSLHAPQVRALTTYTTVAMKWSSTIRLELLFCHNDGWNIEEIVSLLMKYKN